MRNVIIRQVTIKFGDYILAGDVIDNDGRTIGRVGYIIADKDVNNLFRFFGISDIAGCVGKVVQDNPVKVDGYSMYLLTCIGQCLASSNEHVIIDRDTVYDRVGVQMYVNGETNMELLYSMDVLNQWAGRG